MRSILVRLREALPGMSSTGADIARFIRSNPEQAAGMTVRQLAERTYTSPSSVVRVCRALGFSGYKDFRQALMLELAVLRNELVHQEQELAAEDPVDEIIDKVTNKNIQSLEDSRRLIDPEAVARCTSLLKRSKNVLLFGIGASLCVARDAYLKFLRLNKACVLNDDWHSQLLQARNASAQDVGIVFSFSGRTAEVVECMKALRDNGTPIIAVTRYAPSPVAKLADELLYIAANESLFRNGAMSSRIAQLNVVDILYTAFASSEYEYCLEQLARTHIYKDEDASALPRWPAAERPPR